ncbi:MAG: hypothetical protein LC808_00100 [Actinobacteria bacterium]|nr:hypothetical protein [Actinomycetota bacterium]
MATLGVEVVDAGGWRIIDQIDLGPVIVPEHVILALLIALNDRPRSDE